MASYTTEQIRNLALTGHRQGGKTTLVEALLHAGGAIPQPGSVERGTTVSDYLPLEKRYQHSLAPALCHLDHDGCHINLLDTPGYNDLVGRALAVLPAVETVALVINANVGVDAYSQRIMDWVRERGLDPLIIINQIDGDADLEALTGEIQETFGRHCLPLNLPAAGRQRVLDCFFTLEGEETEFSSVEEAHTRLVEQVIEVDEALMELYLEQEQSIRPEQLHDPFEQALREGHLIPICYTSAATGAGVHDLLAVITRLMPHPGEGNPPDFYLGEGPEAELLHFSPDPEAHALAHVFQVTIDPFVGKLASFRVHQGTIRPDSQLYIGDGRKPFRPGHLLALQGKQHTEMARAIPGDICAVAKVEEVHTDAVLHDSHEEDHIHLRPVQLPEPMYGLAVEATARGDEQKLSDVLHRLADEDPSLRIEHNATLNETVIRGLGELHLRIVLEEMEERFGLRVKTHPPSIPYRETITRPSKAQYRHKKQTGGAGQFGEVHLRIEPLPRGAGFEFTDEVVGGAIPKQFIPAVEKGVRQAMAEGLIAGFPVHDVKVTVYDGKHHPVDSKEVAFVTAGKKAFQEAAREASPTVLEPVVRITITAPEACLGDLTGELSGRRGQINGTDTAGNGRIRVTGQVPLSELEDFHSRLKSLSGGEGEYEIEFSHYDPVPPNVQKTLVEARQNRRD